MTSRTTLQMRRSGLRAAILALGVFAALAAAPVRTAVAAEAQSVPQSVSPAVPFVSGMEDLPLMAGLREVPASSIVFDTPQGRIVETFATGRVARAKVLEFYARTLPQLGWRAAGDAVFRREGEILTLEFPGEFPSGNAGTLTVRFALAPVQGR
jgi:hypothetical protein